jgi:hypothetical protein
MSRAGIWKEPFSNSEKGRGERQKQLEDSQGSSVEGKEEQSWGDRRRMAKGVKPVHSGKIFLHTGDLGLGEGRGEERIHQR